MVPFDKKNKLIFKPTLAKEVCSEEDAQAMFVAQDAATNSAGRLNELCVNRFVAK